RARRGRTGSTLGRTAPGASCSWHVPFILGPLGHGQVGRRQTGVGLLLDELLQQRWDSWVWSRGRLLGVGIACAAQAAGVLCFVLGKEPAQHLTGALIDEVDMGEVPACVTHLELAHMAVAVGHLEAAALEHYGAVTLPLPAPLGPGEGQAQRGAVQAWPHDARARKEARYRGLPGLGVDLAVVLVLDPSECRLVQPIQA